MLGDGPNILRLIQIGPLTCMNNGQAITVDTLWNLIGKLLSEANKVMNNQLLLGLHIT
jgi:hypothetical protein